MMETPGLMSPNNCLYFFFPELNVSKLYRCHTIDNIFLGLLFGSLVQFECSLKKPSTSVYVVCTSIDQLSATKTPKTFCVLNLITIANDGLLNSWLLVFIYFINCRKIS